jgi:hypothetical protein
MARVLITGAQQQISTFNPAVCNYDFFTKAWGDEIVTNNRGQNTEVGGAIEALEKMPGTELVPTYSSGAGSAGPLEHASFLRTYRTRVLGGDSAPREQGRWGILPLPRLNGHHRGA